MPPAAIHAGKQIEPAAQQVSNHRWHGPALFPGAAVTREGKQRAVVSIGVRLQHLVGVTECRRRSRRAIARIAHTTIPARRRITGTEEAVMRCVRAVRAETEAL